MHEAPSASLPGWLQHPSHPMRSGALLALLLAFPGAAQYGPPNPQQPPSPAQTHSIEILGDENPQMTRRRLKAFSEDRHKSIARDAQKLLEMARELNTEIQSANPDSLTPAQLRKWSEIEKLAHHVKEKMAAVMQPNPTPAPPLTPLIR